MIKKIILGCLAVLSMSIFAAEAPVIDCTAKAVDASGGIFWPKWPAGNTNESYNAKDLIYGMAIIPDKNLKINAIYFLQGAKESGTAHNIVIWGSTGLPLLKIKASPADSKGMQSWVEVPLKEPFELIGGQEYTITRDSSVDAAVMRHGLVGDAGYKRAGVNYSKTVIGSSLEGCPDGIKVPNSNKSFSYFIDISIADKQ